MSFIISEDRIIFDKKAPMVKSNKMSHVDEQGKARMVDVGHKSEQIRVACASGHIALTQETLRLIADNEIQKGDVLTVAKIAGIQAAKNTPQLIPLCHTLLINSVDVGFQITDNGISVTSTVRCNGKTGVEMEALTAVSGALLTIYDMCKAVDKTMVIEDIKLIKKEKL